MRGVFPTDLALKMGREVGAYRLLHVGLKRPDNQSAAPSLTRLRASWMDQPLGGKPRRGGGALRAWPGQCGGWASVTSWEAQAQS